MKNRNYEARALEHADEAEIERISDRLQQCNVRVIKTDGTHESGSHITTRHKLAEALLDPQVERVEYLFNGLWTTAKAH